MTPEIAVRVADEAKALGFRGFVGFHFYNEPTLYPDFIHSVICARPELRYMLWTNGDALDGLGELFDWVEVTDYTSPVYDDRLGIYDNEPHAKAACYRPDVELAIDCDGGVHLCCQDWREDYGNVIDEPLADIMARLEPVRQAAMRGEGPDVCARCSNAQGVRWG